MSSLRRYRCLNCGNEFEVEVLSPHEAEERRRRNEPVGQVHCPRCNRTDLEKEN